MHQDKVKSAFLVKSKKLTTNLTNPYIISATFWTRFVSPVHKYYNKRITTCDNGTVQSHDQAESTLNSTINANSGAHTLTHNKFRNIHRKAPVSESIF